MLHNPNQASGRGAVANFHIKRDTTFLYKAAVKVDNIREDLGKVGPVIEEQVQEAMLGKRKSLDTERSERTAGEARAVLKVERKIREELTRLRGHLQDSQTILEISPEHVEQVIRAGLALAGQPPLVETTLEGVWPDPNGERGRCPVFRLPLLSGSWALCADGLRHPHTKEIRPIVFDERLVHDRDDAVLVHLNHRLAQMCLGLLRAEVWAPEGRQRALKRVAIRVVPDQALEGPAIVAYARLVVLGADNTRLHEELMTAGGLIREGKLSKLKGAEIEAALTVSKARKVPKTLQEKVAGLWPKHREILMSGLESRAEDRKRTLAKALRTRAEKEADDVAAILTELKRSIEEEFRNEPEQLALFTTPEREQFHRNREALARRAAGIPAEIERERRAVFCRHDNPVARLFPAAVVYLVPDSLAKTQRGDA